MGNKRVKEIIRFVIVGGISFVIDYMGLYVLTEYVNINYLISSSISFTIAVIVNYILSIKFVFRKAKNGYKQLFLFILSSIIALFLNQLCMWFFVELMSLYYMISKLLATLIVTIWNYITKKKSVEI